MKESEISCVLQEVLQEEQNRQPCTYTAQAAHCCCSTTETAAPSKGRPYAWSFSALHFRLFVFTAVFEKALIAIGVRQICG